MKVPFDAGVHPKVKLRLNHQLKQNCGFIKDSTLVDRSLVLKWFENTVNVRLQNVNLTINASTLTGLTDLIEDEVYPTPLPVTVNFSKNDFLFSILINQFLFVTGIFRRYKITHKRRPATLQYYFSWPGTFGCRYYKISCS